jgi:hypothetical protein
LILNKKKSLKKVKKVVDSNDRRPHNIHMFNSKRSRRATKMATVKTFSVAGVSTLNGVTKVRFANDFVNRFKILAKNDHQDIELIELGTEMTKSEICQVLMAHPKFQSEAAQGAIAEYVTRNVKSPKAEKVSEKVEAEQPEVAVTDLEDAPF